MPSLTFGGGHGLAEQRRTASFFVAADLSLIFVTALFDPPYEKRRDQRKPNRPFSGDLHNPPQLARRIDGRLPYAVKQCLVRRLSATPKVEMGLISWLTVYGVEPSLGVCDDDDSSHDLDIKVAHYVTGMPSDYRLGTFFLNFDDIEWEAWGWVATQC